jgi:hypothetical protein
MLGLTTIKKEYEEVNGFAKQQLTIGSKQPVHQHKECNNCNEMKPPEGGIQLSHTKWYCAACWAGRSSRRTSNKGK